MRPAMSTHTGGRARNRVWGVSCSATAGKNQDGLGLSAAMMDPFFRATATRQLTEEDLKVQTWALNSACHTQ